MTAVTEIEPNLHLIQPSGKKIYLVGTAHVSEDSASLVRSVIERFSPDTVCVELCEPRIETLQNASRWKETDIFEVVKTNKSHLLLAQLALASYQRKLADEFGIRPGEEMHVALAVAKERGIPIEAIDRSIRTTLKRAWAGASAWSLLKIFFSFIGSLFKPQEITKEDIEALKESDALTAVLTEFSGNLPDVKRALVDERDLYMLEKLRHAPGDTIVAVVGAGHVPGMLEHIEDEIDLAALDEIPPPSKALRVLTWGIPLLVTVLIVYGFFASGAETSLQMIIAWVLANGVFSALGALLAGAHPFTIGTAFVAAPITSLNPTIAAGWVAGLVEAFLRKPRVSDLEGIGSDISSISGLWKNRVSRILLVVAFANLGSVLGTVIGVGKIVSLL